MANRLKDMVKENRLSEPIEVINYKDNFIIGGKLADYKKEDNLVLKGNEYQLDIDKAIADPEQNFEFSHTKRSGAFECISSFEKDSRYEEKVTFDKYNSNGDLLQYHEADDVNSSFIWAYNKTLPIAKVINAKYNQIAYTSFEDNADYGNWQPGGGSINANVPAKTGKKYLDMYGTNVLQYTFAEAGKYKLEYWSTTPITFSSNSQITIRDISTSAADANGWVLYVKEVTVSAATTMGFGANSAKIDEVRLYPANAQMSTYTYDPLVGMTSETNEKNVTTYYEYDSFGRLSVVKDQDRNVIKTYDYHYKEE
jgi:YD repeat-containing protein